MSETELRRLARDPRTWYLITLIMVVLGAFIPPIPSTLVSPYVQRAYDAVDEIEQGDLVFFYSYWRAVVFPESWSSFEPVIKHTLAKGGVMVIVSTNEESLVLDDKLMNIYWGPKWQESPAYGKEFVYLGYSPSAAAAIYTLSQDFKSLIPVDYAGTPLEDIPATKDVKDATSFKIVYTIGYANRYFAPYWYVPYGIKVIGFEDLGFLAYSIDYWVAGMTELVAGARLGAEYEYLIGEPGLNQKFMSSVFFVTTFVFIGIIVNNYYYFRSRAVEKTGAD